MTDHPAPGRPSGLDIVLREIAASGPLTFRRYMEIALYHPEAGYYRRGSFPGSDYLTAPEVSPLFGGLIGRFASRAAVLLPGEGPLAVIEVGSGSGRMAAAAGASPEISGGAERGEITLVGVDVGYGREAPPNRSGFLPVAGEGLAPFRPMARGLVLANEFFDALPCAVAEYRGGRFREVMVGASGKTLVEMHGEPVTPGLARYLAARDLPPVEGARVEFTPGSRDFLRDLGWLLEGGILLIVDYGGGWEEETAGASTGGTVRCFSSQSVLARPLENPGCADITADVNFADLAAWGRETGWEPVWEGSQKDFLISLGLLEDLVGLARQAGSGELLEGYLAAKRFLMDEGLQERLRVLILGKGLPVALERAAGMLLGG